MQVDSLIVARTVDWYPVHRLVAPILSSVESWPLAGTLPWQHLADTDPAKWAAVLDVARFGALQLHLRQEAMSDASREISRATGWSAVARHVRNRDGVQRRGTYIPRKAAS